MSGSGRKRDLIWNYFDEKIQPGKKGSRVICKACGKELQGLVLRMKNHHEACSLTTAALEGEIDAGNVSSIVSEASSSLSNPSTLKRKADDDNSNSKSKIADIKKFIVKTTSNEKSKIDSQIARYFYATNSPFRNIENPHFIKLMQVLRPGYKPPNKKNLGGDLLNKIYDEEIEKCCSVLYNQIVCLMIDGWSNIHNQPIISVCVSTVDGSIYLVETIDTSSLPHTSENLHSLATNAVKNVELKFKCKIRSLVTDNAPNMSKMRKEIDFLLISYGCSAHRLNLLAKDLNISDVTEHVIQIFKYFRNHQFARAKFLDSKGVGLILPSEVRWNSICDSLESYVKNWPIFMQIVEDEECRNLIEPSIRSKILNMALKRNVEDLFNRLKPISVALDKVQADNCNIAEAVEVWKNLEENLKQLDKASLKSFKKRYEQALSPAHFLAYLLTPKYKAEDLSPNEKEVALDFVRENFHDTELLSIVLKFVIRAPPFCGFLFEKETVESLSTFEWWKSIATVKECIREKELEIIQALITAKASSAGIERMFSTFGFVHSKLRNQLGVEKVAKLVFLFKSLNGKGNQENI